LRLCLRADGVKDRRAVDDVFPVPIDAADVNDRDLPAADADPRRQPNTVGDRGVMQCCLNGASAARGATAENTEIDIDDFRRPQSQQSVAGELHDVAAVCGDQLDESSSTH
jgi:hypothetical protein